MLIFQKFQSDDDDRYIRSRSTCQAHLNGNLNHFPKKTPSENMRSAVSIHLQNQNKKKSQQRSGEKGFNKGVSKRTLYYIHTYRSISTEINTAGVAKKGIQAATNAITMMAERSKLTHNTTVQHKSVKTSFHKKIKAKGSRRKKSTRQARGKPALLQNYKQNTRRLCAASRK